MNTRWPGCASATTPTSRSSSRLATAALQDIAENVALDVEDARAVARLAAERAVDLVVIGPDAAAAAGVADACAARGIPVFGPTAAAARIESSKTFAKEVMR